VVEHLSSLALVETEMAVREVYKCVDGTEKNEVRIIRLTLRLKGIVSELVAVRLVVNVVLFFPRVAVGVR
jgi:hypothetical protein